MKRGFYTIMAAQFFSSLADNALFVAAVELLRDTQAPSWTGAALVPIFALFYVLLAPWLGAFADRLPKGRVMFISNMLKMTGCALILLFPHPYWVLACYALVGLGAAAYSPAKYGILTELLPPSQLVKANGWIEGLTISSILLGVLLGGALVGERFSNFIFSGPFAINFAHFGWQFSSEAAIALLTLVYLVAAGINLRIPRTGVAMRRMRSFALREFMVCNRRLWRDRLGQITLAVTTLFWGVSGNLKYVVLAWAGLVLGYNTSQATSLLGVVAIGTAIGATWASVRARLDEAHKVIVLGIVMGGLVIVMNGLYYIPREPLDLRLYLSWGFLLVLGMVGGYLVVPMNALLQHRGHSLMGSGRSIAVQNFNEQACILLLGGLYVGMQWLGWSAALSIISFGLIVIVVMSGVRLWYARNLRDHPTVMAHLLRLAREHETYPQ
jgi:MFS family permease